ncbi:MAG: Sua5/YciO/YrdC/YwlC family protein [Polyangiaceae bacterium]|nr:Sua5/YciO/YrdC/YwlC family protein [Polyangiaceae bacterium]
MTDASAGLEAAVAALRAGRVVAAPTESSFGLLATLDPAALPRLFGVKPRGHEKGVPLILPDRAAWLEVALPPLPDARRLADRLWPGRLSIATPARPDLDPRVTLDATVAVRLPGPSLAAELARAVGRPLTATSANPPGEPPLLAAAEVRAAFARQLEAGDLVVVGDVAPGGPPSTIVVVVAPAARVVREGAVGADEVRRALLDDPERER